MYDCLWSLLILYYFDTFPPFNFNFVLKRNFRICQVHYAKFTSTSAFPFAFHRTRSQRENGLTNYFFPFFFFLLVPTFATRSSQGFPFDKLSSVFIFFFRHSRCADSVCISRCWSSLVARDPLGQEAKYLFSSIRVHLHALLINVRRFVSGFRLFKRFSSYLSLSIFFLVIPGVYDGSVVKNLS